MQWRQKQALAAAVLEAGKRLAPDRFPQPSQETIDIWAEVLGSISVPPEVWPEAVKVWASDLAGPRMVTPREIKQATKVVLDRWETNPRYRPRLRAWREQRREERDRQLKAGTFAQVRGYTPTQSELPRPTLPEGFGEQLKKNLAKRQG
ncbi:hypothetical protein [Corynebacterium phocae]|uniref:hypothetical protein n=1 Tax=Corynebacterium phocae TaxID=161895 RepID=UPI000951FE79|nr:hypothetical protein [Corynebacterium phocae]